jgi:hypothetical protein
MTSPVDPGFDPQPCSTGGGGGEVTIGDQPIDVNVVSGGGGGGDVTVVNDSDNPIPVTGTVTATVPNPLPVSGTVTANVPNPLPVTGTVTATVPNPLPVTVNGTVTAVIDTASPSLITSTFEYSDAEGTVVVDQGARSVTAYVMTGPVSLDISGTASTIPTGMTVTWSVEDPSEELTDVFTFSNAGTAVFGVATTRG